jgi:flagellar biosynthetic protein FliR
MTLVTVLMDQAGVLVFASAGVFTRIAAALFLVPGFGERAVPMRVRLVLALALSLLLMPLVAPEMPTPPPLSGFAMMIAAEAAAGLIIGLAFRFLVFALQVAGTLAAQNISLSQMFGAGVAPEPEPTIATLLAMSGIVLALMAGLHVHLLAVLAGLYRVLPFGQMPGGGDGLEWSVARAAEAFELGVSLALPFIAIGFAYNLALGALSRAMPQLLVALVGAPLLIGLGMVVLYVSLPEVLAHWTGALDARIADPLGGLR